MRIWLKNKRIKNNLTQAEVALKSNIARTTYAMIEQGTRNPSVNSAKSIAKTLNFDWNYFFDDELHEMRNKVKNMKGDSHDSYRRNTI